MTTLAEYLAAAQDEGWKEQTISDAAREFYSVTEGQNVEQSVIPHIEEIKARVRSLLQQKYQPTTSVEPLAEFAPHMAMMFIRKYCPPSIRAEIEQIDAEFNREKEEYKRISWQEEGKRTRPKSAERYAFNARQNEHVDRMQERAMHAALQLLQAACGSAEEADAYIHMRWLKSHQEEVRRNLRMVMQLEAGQFLSRHMTGRASDAVSEWGSGTSPLRKFVDNGGILSPINNQASNEIATPEED